MRVEHSYWNGQLVGWVERCLLDIDDFPGKSHSDRFCNAVWNRRATRAIETGADAGAVDIHILDRDHLEVGFVFVIPNGAQVYAPEATGC